MNEVWTILAATAALAGVANAILLIILISRRPQPGSEGAYARIEKGQETLEQLARDQMTLNREETAKIARQGREEMSHAMKALADSLMLRMTENVTLQRQQMDVFTGQLTRMTDKNDAKLKELRQAVEERLKSLQDDNASKLDKMRETVDEKLQSTLERRLGDSFRQVSDRLEQVHKGLGEMHHLAQGVGDLRRVLTNVKSRGTWGEIQLGTLLENIFSPEQYGKNVATKPGSQERVEYAVRLPGRNGMDAPVWLPIDAKFPQEDFQRLQEAQDRADAIAADEAAKQLEARIRLSAKEIKNKYVEPPHTTDFAILFLPVEALYAEVLRRPGLMEALQRDFRIVIAGPTTLSAFLNSMHMGFRTLAIEKRSSEVWNLLAGVKKEFGQFGKLLDSTTIKLRRAGEDLERAARQTRRIELQLREVEELPSSENPSLFDEGPKSLH